jgi:hypothetical protein
MNGASMKLSIAIPATALAVTAAVLAAGQPANAAVSFATPLAATRYFAAAVDNGDLAALHQVTTPASFKEVMGMRRYVRDVLAKSCAATGRGDYDCVLNYQYRNRPGTGSWNVIVAPADSPGWYVYQYAIDGCD